MKSIGLEVLWALSVLALDHLSAVSGAQCFVSGFCLGTTIATTSTDSPQLCLQRCQDDVADCQWFTHDPSSDFCILLTTCTLDTTSCPTCISGEVSCTSGEECHVDGACTGSSTGLEDSVASEEQCKQACAAVGSSCNWYTYYPDTGFCLFFLDCTIQGGDCGNCVSGTPDCSETPVDPDDCYTEDQSCIGNLVGSQPAATQADCELACSTFDPCNYYTYYTTGQICLLYSTCTLTGDEDCITGDMECIAGGLPSTPGDDTKILIAGGRSTLVDVELVDLPSALANGVTTTCAKPSNYPIVIETAVANLIDNRVTICGGFDGYQTTWAECFQLDPTTNGWIEFYPGLPDTRAYADSVTVPGQGWFVLGGFGNDQFSPTDTTVILSESTGTWISGPVLPYEAYELCAVQINDTHTFVAGGIATGDRSDGAFIYDWSNRRWVSVGPMSSVRESPACGLYTDEYVVVTGGLDDSPDDLLVTELYVLSTGTWMRGPDLPFWVTGATLVRDDLSANGGDLILIGSASDRLLLFSPGEWTELDQRLFNGDRRFAPALAVPDVALYQCRVN